jgi:hypothetical protein
MLREEHFDLALPDAYQERGVARELVLPHHREAEGLVYRERRVCARDSQGRNRAVDEWPFGSAHGILTVIEGVVSGTSV